MKVLFVTPQIPLPNVGRCGAAVKNFYLIKRLSSWHEIQILTLIDGKHQTKLLDGLAPYCKKICCIKKRERSFRQRLIQAISSNKPDLQTRIMSPELEDGFRTIVERDNFDIIQIEGLELSDLLLKLNNSSAKKVLDEHNAEYVLAWRNMVRHIKKLNVPLFAYSFIQFFKLANYEKKLLGKVDLCLTVSNNDLHYLKKISPYSEFLTIPTSVEPVSEKVEYDKVENSIIFTGVMFYKPNVDGIIWFCSKVFPLIKKRVPNAKLFIVGKGPVKKVKKLFQDDAVTIAGEVADIGPFYRNSKVAVVPLKLAGGTSTKALEAMAYGLPVVMTRSVARSMGIHIYGNLAVAENAKDFAEKVILFLREKSLWELYSERAMRTIQRDFNINEIAFKLSTKYAHLVGATQGSTFQSRDYHEL